MGQQKNGVPGGVYFFISIEARGKAAVFRDAFFKTKVERRWTEIVSGFPKTSGKEYVVNDRVVHAIVHFLPDAEEIETMLDKIIAQFKARVTVDWKGEGELWSPNPKIRKINTPDELRSLRGFIVQKMLGGKELTLLNELDDEEDDDDSYYYN